LAIKGIEGEETVDGWGNVEVTYLFIYLFIVFQIP
jgi:hypothetical protein